MQFVDGHFVESYYPTIENTFSKVIKYKGQEYATEIIDTAGQVCVYQRDMYFFRASPHVTCFRFPFWCTNILVVRMNIAY